MLEKEAFSVSYKHSSYHGTQKENCNINKKFWQELICLLSLHKLTLNNLVTVVTMEHKQTKPTAEQGSPNNVDHQ
jgi:hypothetical protein